MQTVNLYTENFFLEKRVRNLIKKILRRESPGPQKVLVNLTKGLNKAGVNVVVNVFKTLSAAHCVLSGEKVVTSLVEWGCNNIVVGPNITARAMTEIYNSYGKSIKTILAPSPEVKAVYEYYGIPDNKITIWPVGIDTQEFPDVAAEPKKYNALVYFKRRNRAELSQVIELLNTEKQSYKILEYGGYSVEDFRNALKDCRYTVVLDGTESQGIAIEEIMSSNLPMFVLDQIYLGESNDLYLKDNFLVTSVPYWSNVCGVKIATDMYGESKQTHFSILETRQSFVEFLSKLYSFNPRKYVLENLEMVNQAKKFLDIVN